MSLCKSSKRSTAIIRDRIISRFRKRSHVKKSLIGFLLASCVATSQPKSGQLVGHWRYTDVNARVDMEFGADGEFSGRVVREGAPVFTYSGKWTLKDADLDYVYTKSSLA